MFPLLDGHHEALTAMLAPAMLDCGSCSSSAIGLAVHGFDREIQHERPR